MNERLRAIAAASGGERVAAPGIKSCVLEYLERHSPACVDETELDRLVRFVRARLDSPRRLSASYLLRVLSVAGVEIARSLGGLPVDLRGRVHFHDPEAAASSLLDMAREYRDARQTSDRLRRDDCRRAVRQAKDCLKLHLRRRGLSEPQRAEKEELLAWFLVWLETPELFPQWLKLRQAALLHRGGE